MFSALNYCGGIFFKCLSYVYEVGCTNFSFDFRSYHNFRLQFRKNFGNT